MDAECLAEGHLDYHHHVLAEARRAQAALDSWQRFLTERYLLTPFDAVAEDGSISRGAASRAGGRP